VDILSQVLNYKTIDVGKQSAISSIALENSFVCTPTPHSKITRNLIKREF
jgi:hypothetical protein